VDNAQSYRDPLNIRAHAGEGCGVIHVRNIALVDLLEDCGCDDTKNHGYDPMYAKPVPGCCELIFVSMSSKEGITERPTVRPIYTGTIGYD
jgi:hypothetical protein